MNSLPDGPHLQGNINMINTGAVRSALFLLIILLIMIIFLNDLKTSYFLRILTSMSLGICRPTNDKVTVLLPVINPSGIW